MTFQRGSREMDSRIADFGDSTARRISRRDAATRLLRGTVVAVAGISAGQVGWARAALADSAKISCPDDCFSSGGFCPGSGYGTQCPSGYTLCKKSTGCYHCTYADGSWVHCTGLGSHGYGYSLCLDCWKNGNCSTGCVFQTSCICCQCATPADVAQEMTKLQASGIAGANTVS